MSLFQRAHDILAAKTNKALDAAEKPDEMLDLSYEQMLDQITKVRQALVTIAASRKRIELQEQQLQHSVDHLQDQAQAALAQGREDLAREALTRKAAAQTQIDGMEPQHQQLTEEEQKMEHTLRGHRRHPEGTRRSRSVRGRGQSARRDEGSARPGQRTTGADVWQLTSVEERDTGNLSRGLEPRVSTPCWLGTVVSWSDSLAWEERRER